jgi:apolipoprotein N-acyltransferase
MAFTPPEDERRLLFSAGNLIQSRAKLQGTDLLVFPEGFSEGDPSRPPYSALGPAPEVPVVMGGKRTEGDKTYQTAFGWDGRQWSHADKTRLVVFGEYVPFRGWPFLDRFRLPSGDLTAAQELKTVTVGDNVIGPLLCFEGVFPDLAERHGRLGARMLAQMSIDDWYEGTPAWDQLWLSSVWRSIESGLPLVRVGGRGRSLATDARGNVLAAAPVGAMSALRVELGLPAGSDAYPYRMAFVHLCWATCAVVAVRAVALGPAELSK